MIINYFGPLDDKTGYGVHATNLRASMSKKGVEFVVDKDFGLPCLAICLPEQWRFKSACRHKPFIPFLVFEGTQLSKDWVDLCNQDYITELLVPSSHVKEVAIKSGVKKEMTIAPHGVNPELFNTKVKPLSEIKDDSFKFFMLGGWGQGRIDRKGSQYALRAFSEEFKSDEPVELWWKINTVYNPGLDYNTEIKACGVKPDTKLKVLTQDLPFEKIASLYKGMDCFVAPSMADAFNMPVAESMAVGLPVITTKYSGMLDYVDDSVGWLIDVECMTKALGQPEHIYECAEWAVPSVKHLRELMRYAYEHKDECKKKGGVGALRISENYTWDKTADKVIKVFKKYGL